MSLYIGLDIGTTNLGAVVVDVDTGALQAHATIANTAYLDTPPGRVELGLPGLERLLVCALSEVASQVPAGQVRGIGITGQMHGVALLDQQARPLAAAINWQDQRALEIPPGGDQSYLRQFIAEAGGAEAFERMGCLPAPGYMGTSLYWLKQHNALPTTAGAVACLVPDAAVSLLTGRPPCTDPTDGGSSGLLDLVSGDWAWAAIDRLGLPRTLFPQVRAAGTPYGSLRAEVAALSGLSQNTPVHVALGDNQASFIGSVGQAAGTLLLNVGTGAQISALSARFDRLPGLDTRAFPGGDYLLVGAGLFGGRTLAYLRSFFWQVGRAFYGGHGDETLYDEMVALAEEVPSGCDGLRCVPTFTGTRVDADVRAGFSGLSPENFTPGHMTRALLEGMASAFYDFYEQMAPLIAPPERLVGSGNGIARNRLFARILAQRFGLPLYLPALNEEAAVGAALLAAVGSGEISSLAEAMGRLQYADVIQPE